MAKGKVSEEFNVCFDKERETKYFVWRKIAQSRTISRTIEFLSHTIGLQNPAQF